jgi:hypothetical protein
LAGQRRYLPDLFEPYFTGFPVRATEEAHDLHHYPDDHPFRLVVAKYARFGNAFDEAPEDATVSVDQARVGAGTLCFRESSKVVNCLCKSFRATNARSQRGTDYSESRIGANPQPEIHHVMTRSRSMRELEESVCRYEPVWHVEDEKGKARF